MDELNEFFNLTGEAAKKVQIDGAEMGGRIHLTQEDLKEMEECDRTPYKVIDPNFDYVTYYRNKEKEEQEIIRETRPMDALDDVTSLGGMSAALDLVEENFFYNKHVFRQRDRPELAISSMKEEILEMISDNSVTIIEGPTGCGKTTQVPQWILQSSYSTRKYCNIIVTQPRRIAAISIAQRVCNENDFELGGLVGYQVALDSKTSPDTRLTYVTTGVLLQKLVTTRTLQKYTHIVLDEVHERNQDMDFLFIVVKKLLRHVKGVKIILMSATFNRDKFSEYFDEVNDCLTPAVLVENECKFKSSIFYLDLLSMLGKPPEISYSEPKISKEMYMYTLKTLNAFEDIDLMEEVPYTRPSVLIFLPGIYEIEQLYNVLNDYKIRNDLDPTKAKLQWWLIPLHSTITIEEQVRVFRQPPPDHRKIIMATNIAESSITVPDIKYVIDFCLSKVLMSNRETNFSSLQLTWASKANCAQRAGRAGRVRDGRVYRMVPKEFYDKLSDECIPEIQRCPLDNLVLAAKLLDMGTPLSILSLAMDPPDCTDIAKTILNLKQIGALLKTDNGEVSVEDGDITFIGRIMAKLPLDTKVSKLIVLGYVFGCLEECIIIGGAMSVRNVFSTPFQERMSAYSAKLTWTDGSNSDLIALLNVYKTYKYLSRDKYFVSARHGERGWSKKLFLQINALHEMDSLIKELKHRLTFEEVMDTTRHYIWKDSELGYMLKLLIAGAFYPFYFTFSHGGDTEEREATKVLGGRDPRNTVYLTSMDHRQPVALYAQAIKRMFSDCTKEEVVVSSDGSGSKVYITFPTQGGMVQGGINEKCSIIPGKVALPVYKAIKMRQLKMPLTLNIMTQHKAIELATELGLWPPKAFNEWDMSDSEEDGMDSINPRLPDIEDTYIDIFITFVIDCAHFWAQYADDSSQKQLRWIENKLACPGTLSPLQEPPKLGVMYAAPYQDSPQDGLAYYRAKVNSIMQNGTVAIQYIDYGNGAIIKSGSLQIIGGEFADSITTFKALAFEARLTEIAPSIMLDSRGLWTNVALNIFKGMTKGVKIIGKVYSVAHCVVSLELFINNMNVNHYLVEEGYAMFTEESYASKENRALRDSVKRLQISQKIALNKQQAKKLAKTNIQNMSYPPPNPADCVRRIELKGPYSPLETQVHNLMYAGKDKAVSVQWDSVNSVILNSDPQDPCERLLVASNVDLSSSGEHVTLRNTTLMPSIRGLPALVALMFCPTAEMHPDLTCTKYSSVLCGVGHMDGKPLFPEHDILVSVDAEITNEDLIEINRLRFLMDSMLLTQGSQATPTCSEDIKLENRLKIKHELEKIIFKERKYREPGSSRKPWQWGLRHHGLEVETVNHYKDRAIFPPHGALLLREMGYDVLMKRAEANQMLYQMCNGILLAGNNKVECTLCKTDLLSITEMRVHLASRLHKDQEADLPDVRN